MNTESTNRNPRGEFPLVDGGSTPGFMEVSIATGEAHPWLGCPRRVLTGWSSSGACRQREVSPAPDQARDGASTRRIRTDERMPITALPFNGCGENPVLIPGAETIPSSSLDWMVISAANPRWICWFHPQCAWQVAGRGERHGLPNCQRLQKPENTRKHQEALEGVRKREKEPEGNRRRQKATDSDRWRQKTAAGNK